MSHLQSARLKNRSKYHHTPMFFALGDSNWNFDYFWDGEVVWHWCEMQCPHCENFVMLWRESGWRKIPEDFLDMNATVRIQYV